MKKFVRFLICSTLLVILCCFFIACNNNSSLLDNNSELNQYTHLIKINNEELFNYYFSFSATNYYSSNYNFGTSNSSKYGTKSTSTITVTPKLTGFVEYSGYVELQAETENENKSSKVLKNRHINIEYWGATTDIYEVSNETQQDDSTISFNDVDYKFCSINVTVTYHHEGLSGNINLTYETILITKYNYKSYFTINIKNESYHTTSYAENDIYHRNPIYTYHYYQTYTITPSSQIKGYKEFNHIVFTFDNGIVMQLDAALGNATYQSQKYSVEKAIPELFKISGCIDFYPSAIYEY